MSLAQQSLAFPALERTYVALDLETTGLDKDRDRIIQVGAVKFRGDQVLDIFDTFVNPGRPIPDFIQRLTGIRPEQVSRAPFFSSIRHQLDTFLEGLPVVGHNIRFDLDFLDREGLSLPNPSYDTWDLASFLLPRNPEYNLQSLIRQFKLSSKQAHQAVDDADATRQLFVTLLRRAGELHPGLRAYVGNLAYRGRWGVADLLAGLDADYETGYETDYERGNGDGSGAGKDGASSLFSLSGLDLSGLAARLGHPERRRYDANLNYLDEGKIVGLLSPGGPFAKTFPGFEQRPEQTEMLESVARAIYQGRHLIVEGGTGVGKSMAYLLPAALYALSRGQRVVISTNTINLQEQLIKKDIPAMIGVLEGAGIVEPGLIKATPLKGRANYLCLNRWNYLAHSDAPTVEEARLLSKTAVWLQDTVGGDRGEINLSGRDAFSWSKVSAGEKAGCPALRSNNAPCFLRSAREQADQAHIVVVNHALLLSDLVRGGGIIPDYQRLVIDEAHNLEDVATAQLSRSVGAGALAEETEPLARLARETRRKLGVEGLDSPARQRGEEWLGRVEAPLPRLRERWGDLWAAAQLFFNAQRTKNNDFIITTAARAQRSWSDLADARENVGVGLNELIRALEGLEEFFKSAKMTDGGSLADLHQEAENARGGLEELQGDLDLILNREDEQTIRWLRRDTAGGRDEVNLHAAPLEVGALLAEKLFSQKESVVLTSATLSTEQSFDYLRHRLGIPEESGELLVGSPFDYRKAALLLTPEDMPNPNQPAEYYRGVSQILQDLGRVANGRTMALFTAYTALRNVDKGIRDRLKMAGIEVLAQGTDGSAQQIMRRFAENHANDIPTVLLGTSSFWEGVDFPGVLKALVIARLPFQVPTDPVVKTRSDQYGPEAFSQYSIPNAALRFRQGIGRLIRSKGDSGVIVVLDSRINGGYGRSFINSIPECSRQPSSIANVGWLAGQWLKEADRGTDR